MEPEKPNTEFQVKQANPLFQATPFSKYLAMALFIAMPFIGGWIGYRFTAEKNVIKESLTPSTAQDTKSDDKLADEAIQSYLSQKLSTIAVIDTPTPYVQIAVAADREGSVYCGYDNGPCYIFLQASHADYPKVRYAGSVESRGVFNPSTMKFISPSVFQFETHFGDAGTSIKEIWNFDIGTGRATKVSEEKEVLDI